MIQWRIEYGADRLLHEYVPPRALLYYVPSAILKGYDRDGEYVTRVNLVHLVDGLSHLISVPFY